MKSTTMIALILAMCVGCFELKPKVSACGQQRPDIYKEPVDPSKLPKGKFRSGHPDAISGEYLVFFTEEVKEADVEKLADELVAKYGGAIKTHDGVMETKQADGLIKTEVLARGKKVIFKGKINKGFSALMTEAAAKALSEDVSVDHVNENVRLQVPANQNTPGGIVNPAMIKPPKSFQ